MVIVAELVKRLIVVQEIVGSSPTFHTNAVFVFPCYLLERKYTMAKREYGTRKKYHFIYKTTNLLSGRYYIGMHSTNDLNDGYLGSGTLLRRSINKHGKENHSIEILEFVNSREQLAAREKEIVSLQEVAKKECMNLKIGGSGGLSSEEHKQSFIKAGTASRKICRQDPEWVSWHSTQIKLGQEKVNFIHATFLGKKHTEDSKKKIGATNATKQKGSGNSQFGKCWITDEVNNKKIHKGDLIPEGWRLGRHIK